MDELPKQDNRTEQSESPRPAEPDVSPVIRIFATGLFSGYAPFASGTFGSMVGVLVYLIPGFEDLYVILPASAIVFILGSLAAGLMERGYGHDPSIVTIDEVLGMWVSLLLLPKTAVVVAAAFILFRFFDIIKPPPARIFDRMTGGWNIMLDDVVAGIYANLLLQAAIRIL
ncbi:MAG TPA: phosphatidylglycerophosphatase A [Bacteroidota bacterium]|nr:phosphatidylglycerophosphatase A [Bacteroidota bacterium]